jgi:hypothetical protein
MSQSRRSGGGFTGHPAIIFWLMTDFGRSEMSMQGNLSILDKWVSQLDAVLQFKSDYETEFEGELEEINQDVLDAWSIYDPVMESAGFAQNEKELIMIMRLIYRKLNRLTAKAHICDAVRFDEAGDDVE